MNYVRTLLQKALLEVQQEKLEANVRTEFSCGKEIKKITIIEKQLERSLFLSTNYGTRVKLTKIDHTEIKELLKEYTYSEVANIYNVSDTHIKKFINNKLNN